MGQPSLSRTCGASGFASGIDTDQTFRHTEGSYARQGVDELQGLTLNMQDLPSRPSYEPVPFQAELAYEHTRALCYPRRVGTRGERRAAHYLFTRFTELGLTCWRERFTVSHFPAEIGNRLAFLLCAALVVLGAWSFSAPAAAACFALAAIVVNSPWRLHRLIGRTWLPRCRSENILASLPGPANAAPTRVVFIAHYDTKSQVLPTGIRVALVTLATGLCAGLALAAGLRTLRMSLALSPTATGYVAVVILAALAGLIANATGNRSPGALDNGSAVGTLLELARAWRPRPQAPADVVWVATGSEEVGLDGARHLLEKHGNWWNEKPTLLVNLESVGAGAIVYLSGEAEALGLARETARELGLVHAPLRVLGAGMDHEPFAAHGLTSVSILGDVVRNSFALHSRRDDLKLIEPAALDRAGRLAARLAWRWAELHQPATIFVPEVKAARRTAIAPASAPLG